MHILVAALIALLIGIAVKFALGFFETSKKFADPVALIVAVLAFLAQLGVVK